MFNGADKEYGHSMSAQNNITPYIERVIEHGVQLKTIEKDMALISKSVGEMSSKIDKLVASDKMRSMFLYACGAFILAHFTGVLRWLMKLAS